jgi:hypothetical protein
MLRYFKLEQIYFGFGSEVSLLIRTRPDPDLQQCIMVTKKLVYRKDKRKNGKTNNKHLCSHH